MPKLTLEFSSDDYESLEDKIKFGIHGNSAYDRLYDIESELRSTCEHKPNHYRGEKFDDIYDLIEIIRRHIREDGLMDILGD